MDFGKLIKLILAYWAGITGQGGTNLTLNTTAAQTNCNYMCVQGLGASGAVIASIVIDGAADSALAGYNIARGEMIWGNITAITLTSGTVRLYANGSRVFAAQ